MPAGSRDSHRIAIVGASSLLGKELKQVLEDRNFPASDVVLLDETVMAGRLTEVAGEATFIRALEEDSFEGSELAFFAGTGFDAERNWQVAQHSGATVIDLTGALAASDQAAPLVSRWIPALASVLPPLPAKGTNGSPARVIYSSPGTPVIIACTLAGALGKSKTEQISVVLFPPVSEQDQSGIEELETQTASLLSFREISKSLFDEQVAFNLLGRYGSESRLSLMTSRNAIAREAHRFLNGRSTVPAIQLVQAPTFYGYAFSAFGQLDSEASVEQLNVAFANLGVKITEADDPGPTNVSVAGETEIVLGPIELDPNVKGGAWIWGAADNLRLAATNAARIAEELVGKRTN
jgi:aspartate-semialdehyde dehydrogenase